MEIKAQRSAEKIWGRWPDLEIMWYRINGGEPVGEESLPWSRFSILTPNLWYAKEGPWSGRAYACWPPFYRLSDHFEKYGRSTGPYTNPICLVHNFSRLGYGAMGSSMRDLGITLHGKWSPDGLIRHEKLPEILSNSIAMVHLKNNDAPGYALYEALASGCPLIVSQRLIWRNWMQDMFVDEDTCLVFDDPGDIRLVHHSHTPEQIETCVKEVKEHLERLKDPDENLRIGMNGYNKLKELMWNAERDGESFKNFMGDMYD